MEINNATHNATHNIPMNSIQQLLHSIFPSHTILHFYTPSHVFIKTSQKDFVEAPVQNWKYNRPPDMIRCEEIAHYIENSHKPLETVFYLSYNAKCTTFDVLDGIHRYKALQIIEKNRNLKHDMMDFITNDSNQSIILLNIRFNATDGELVDIFQALNNVNPVPDLYVRDTAKDKKDAIEAVVLNWTKRFKAHFSAATKPKRPNVNRDRFMDLLSEVWDKYQLTQETALQLQEKIETANERVRNEMIGEDVNANMREKCEVTGCWLFMHTMETLEQIV